MKELDNKIKSVCVYPNMNSPSNLNNVCVLLIEGRSLYEYTLMLYVLNELENGHSITK